MRLREILIEMPAGPIVGVLPPVLAVLSGSDHVDLCIEVFEKADQPALYRALNSTGLAIPGTQHTLSVNKNWQVIVGPSTGREPAWPPDWLERIHSTAGGGTIIWLGDICAVKKPELAAHVQADIAHYVKVPGGWRRR